MICGGEILRAVMEASCVNSLPSFYTIPMQAPSSNGTVRGQIQCHKDRWFLTTATVPTATSFTASATDTGFERLALAEFVRLFDPSNNSDFSFNPATLQQSLIGDTSFNFQFTLPEYILWAPNSLIGVEWTGAGIATNNLKMLTLAGIEYFMPGS